MASKGILGRKLGMTQVWDAENRVVPVTVIQAGPCRVVQLKTPERDGYAAVQLSFGDTKPARTTVETRFVADMKVEIDCVAYAPGK